MKIGIGTRALMIAAFGAVAALPASQAAAQSDREEIQALVARLKKLEAKVAQQEREDKAIKAQAQHATNIANAAVIKGPAPPPVFVSFKNGLAVETLDRDFYFKVGGRILVDGGTNTEPEQTFPLAGWPSLAKPFWTYIDPAASSGAGYSNNVTFRQARLEVEGKAWRDWYYKFQVDFAGSPNDLTLGMIRDAWLAYRWNTGILPITFQVGNQFEASGLERENSSKYRDFIERAFVSDLMAGNRHVGAAAVTGGETIGLLGQPAWSLKSGVYSTSFEDGNPQKATTSTSVVANNTVLTNFGIPAGNSAFLNPVSGGHQYWDLASRLIYAPVRTSDALLHVGGSVRYEKPNDATAASDDRMLQPGYTLKSEANAVGDPLLGTQPLSCVSPLYQTVGGNCVKSIVNLAAEAVAAYGPVSVQAEYSAYHYDRDAGKIAAYNAIAASGVTSNGLPYAGAQFAPGGASVNFRGFYVYGTWYLTGESRADSYLAYPDEFNTPGTFGQIKIKHPLSQGGWGAWELAARFSTINLNDGHTLFYIPPTATYTYGSPGFLANQNIQGGRQSDVTLGLNWYPEKGVRVMANWVNTVQYSANWARPDLNGIHPQAFELRAQVDW